ncbi:alpha/beta-hydrolase [Parathielavia appendiculata]|uniref:Alpha/beta-hydrolase n=1 Tax=Parathielavia appendiculata TaxID=2587402 RepID=A0AAN6TUB1_9PEZI|nr:alpha/beta-hydrolase [Parathielavia appendiculata]
MCDFSCYGGASDEWLALEASLPPPPPLGQSVEEKRRAVNEGREQAAAQAMEALSRRVRTRDHSIPTRDGSKIKARSYRPRHVDGNASEDHPLPVYIHLHGGGFLFGTLASEDATCARVCLNARVVVLNVNYRHTPEHGYPKAWNDVEDAFEWLHDNMQLVGGDAARVVVGGISAGAQLTASLVLGKHVGRVAAPRPAIAGQVLMIPALVNMDCYEPQVRKMKDPSASSYEENKDAPILPVSACRFFTDLLKIDRAELGAENLKLNPGNAAPEQVKGLPPTVFGIAGLDPLRDEGLLYAKMLTESGVPTNVHLFKGVPHGFRRFGDKLSASKKWDEVMENGIRWALGSHTACPAFSVHTW